MVGTFTNGGGRFLEGQRRLASSFENGETCGCSMAYTDFYVYLYTIICYIFTSHRFWTTVAAHFQVKMLSEIISLNESFSKQGPLDIPEMQDA